MALGLVTTVIGYTLLYWGIEHMPGQKVAGNGTRNSLWELFGFGTLFKGSAIGQGPPVQWKNG